ISTRTTATSIASIRRAISSGRSRTAESRTAATTGRVTSPSATTARCTSPATTGASMRSNSLLWIAIALAGCGTSTFNGGGDGGGGKDGSVNFNFDFATGMVCSPSDPPSCDGNSIRTCRFDGSGYDYSPCAMGCLNGACTCNPGDLQCLGPVVQKCDANGEWQNVQTCMNGTQCTNAVCGERR